MSKLLKKLERVSRGETAPVGFAAAGRKEKAPPMLLVAMVSSADTHGVSRFLQEGADAVLVRGESIPEDVAKLAEGVGEVPWGIWLSSPQLEDEGRLQESGCDFMILKAETAPASLLGTEGPTKILAITPSVSDALARAISLLPVEAVLLTQEAAGDPSLPLMVQGVMDCLRLKSLVAKPLLVMIHGGVTGQELQSLRDIGVEAVVVAQGGQGGIGPLRGLINDLRPPRKRSGRRLEPFIPFGREVAPPAEEEEWQPEEP